MLTFGTPSRRIPLPLLVVVDYSLGFVASLLATLVIPALTSTDCTE